jgi:hypothetical protein
VPKDIQRMMALLVWQNAVRSNSWAQADACANKRKAAFYFKGDDGWNNSYSGTLTDPSCEAIDRLPGCFS